MNVRPLPALGVATAVLLAAGLAAVPAVGQTAAQPTPPSPVCPSSAAPGANTIAGYTLSTQASGLHAALNSPGLLPVGDAAVGTIVGVDIPLARVGVSAGPVTSAVSSPIYPGDAVAHLGTALGTFGVPIPVPNYPVVAEADFPPSPQHGGSSTFSSATLPVQAFTAESHAAANAATSVAHVVSTDLGGAFTTGVDDAASAADLRDSCVDASATATTSGIVIAGLINIADVAGYAAARSDGKTAVPQAELKVGKVTVAGLPAYIDRDGIHLASQQPVGAGAVAAVESLLDKTLAATATTIKLLPPTTTVQAGEGSADSGAILVTTKQTLPAIGHPPQGTPPIPLVVELSYGHAQVSVNATSVPALPVVSPSSPAVSTPIITPSESGSAGGSALAPVESTPSSSVALSLPSPPGPQQQILASNVASPPAPGSPVPIGWILVGLALCIVAIGPLLGYARWQLLEGRL
jgi:hypothetical protein